MSVIAIVGGTGPEGTGLASRWARAGESVILGSRQADRAHTVAERLRQTLGSGAAIEGDENSAAVARAEIVVLTIPFSAHAETLKNLKSAFRPAAVLIDTTVPLASSVGGRATQLLGVWQGSAAQQAAELVPKGVVVAAAFQNISAELLPGTAPVECDAIICADDSRAREVASELAGKIPRGHALEGGKLENARTGEQATDQLTTQNTRRTSRGPGRRIASLRS